MARRRDELEGLLGPLETEVMETVWEQGETTVREVHAQLASTRDIAYTTVMTTMTRLASKGLLERDTSGLAHRYRPAITRDEYAHTTVTSVVDWLVERFPEPALSYFVQKMDADEHDGTADLRDRVERMRQQEG